MHSLIRSTEGKAEDSKSTAALHQAMQTAIVAGVRFAPELKDILVQRQSAEFFDTREFGKFKASLDFPEEVGAQLANGANIAVICGDPTPGTRQYTEEDKDRMMALQESLCMKRLIEYIRSGAMGSPDDEASTRAEFLIYAAEMARLSTPNESLSADLVDLHTVAACTTLIDGTDMPFGNVDSEAVVKLRTSKTRMEQKEHRFHKPMSTYTWKPIDGRGWQVAYTGAKRR